MSLNHVTHFVTHHLAHTHTDKHIFVANHLSHTSLSHTIFHTHLCHTPSFTHIFHTHHCSHNICHTASFTHIFVTHHLSHHLCHTPSTSTFVLRGRRGTYGRGLVARLGLLDRACIRDVAVVLRGRRGTWRHPPAFCLAGVAPMGLGWVWWRLGPLGWG